MRNFTALLCGAGAILALCGSAALAADAPASAPTTTPAAPAPTTVPAPPQAPVMTPPPAPGSVQPTTPQQTAPIQIRPNPANMPPPPPPGGGQEPVVTSQALNAPGIHAVTPAKIDVTGIAGRVNGQVITNQELVARFLRDGGQTTLNEMITGALVDQAAKKSGITLTHAQIMDKYSEFKAEVLKQAPAGYTWTQVLSAEGRSEEYALEQVRLRLLLEKLVAKQLPPVSLDGKIHIFHILIATVPLPPQHPAPHKDDEARTKIEQIAAEIASGKITFKDAARKYSEDDSTKASGGDLGWISHQSNLDPTFSAAAFNLKEGEVSPPVKSQYGWHLIYLQALGSHATAAEKQQLQDEEVKEEAPRLIGDCVRNLRDSAQIDRVLMPGVALPKPQSSPMQFEPQAPIRHAPAPIVVKPTVNVTPGAKPKATTGATPAPVH